ncbi:MAG: aminomethyltransferase family protein [Deltaproteobacteria bacterium]|nr:aminomethyltransferase family protein [Deltaproteobacteria bacterium]
MKTDEVVAATRVGAGLFPMAHRGLLEVRGEDRVRWLDGMISGDVEALVAAGPGAGCYATLLTNRGAIVADLHVGLEQDRFLLESARESIPRIQETLERFVIADDVALVDVSDQSVAIGLEGPRAEALLDAASGGAQLPAPEEWATLRIAGHPVQIAAFGFTGESAFQLRIGSEGYEALEKALFAASEALGPPALVRGTPEALEILRVEAGIPLLGHELDDEVLPPEARLERAIATDKGCYVGQEIIARLRARGQVNHLIVGLRIEGADLPPVGAKLSAGERETGELTSVARSPSQGPIALGYVRREHAEEGTELDLGGGRVRVAALPFVACGAPRPEAA